MDLGVGSFVFSNGMAQAMSQVRRPKQLPFGQELLFVLRRVAVAFGLGLVRVAMVKGADYPVRIAEP
jgi:hypothetical protein